MINNLFPTATDNDYLSLYKAPDTNITADISALHLNAIPTQYAVGYTSIDNVPYYHKLSTVTKSGSVYTISANNKIDNCDIVYVSSISNVSNYITATVKNDVLTSVKYDSSAHPTSTPDIRFVNDIKVNNVADNYANLYLSFYGVAYFSGSHNSAFYGRIDGLKNILKFLDGEDVENFIIARVLSDSRTHIVIPKINVSDFENGVHLYTVGANSVKIWIAGLGYATANMPDTWQNKNWSSSDYGDRTNIKTAYVLSTADDAQYLSATRLTGYPEYTSNYTDQILPNYIKLDSVYNEVSDNCIWCDIDATIDSTGIHSLIDNVITGKNWIFLNNGINRIYYCCNGSEIRHQLSQTVRALHDSAFTYNNNPLSYTVNDAFCYPEVTAQNEYTGNIIITSDSTALQSWQNDKINTNDYDYHDKPEYDPAKKNDFGDLISNIGINTQTATTGKLFKIQPGDVYTVLNFIGGTYSTDLIMSPSDGLISFNYFPFDIPSANVSEIPHIGAYNDDGTIKGFIMPVNVSYLRVYNTSYMIDLGSTIINAMYNDFRDYPPYTTYSAFIPFINTSYTIDFGVFKNHTIGFKLIVDVLTGSAICCIMRDRLLYDTVNGSVSTQININSADMAQYNASIKATENAMQANELNMKLAVANMITGLTSAVTTMSPAGVGTAVSSVTGALSTVAQSALNRDMLDYQLQTTQVHHSTIQTASANCGNQLERQVHIIIAHAKMLPEYNAKNYADTVGYACCKNTTLAKCSHFTQIADIELEGITATDSEKNMIKTALINGVIIK